MDLKFKTLTLKKSGLCVIKRVLNHKSIPIYYVDKENCVNQTIVRIKLCAK